MVAIRSLLLAGAFAGMSAAAQIKTGRSLLQATPPPVTGDAALVNTLQQFLQGDVAGTTGAVTSATGGLAGISGRHLLQTSPPPPVTTQLTSAATDAGNTVVSSVQSLLETLELEPQPEPASRHLLQATPPPVTDDAALVNTLQQFLQGDVAGTTGAVTSATGGLAGISGRHLLQTSPPPPVTTQLTSAATDAGNTVVSSVQSLLGTLELEPQPEATC